MNDNELLEFAAKAAGIRIDHKTSSPPFRPPIPEGSLVIFNDLGGHSIWNPLTDDGDALRLAVKLQLAIAIDPDQTWSHHVQVMMGSAEPHGNDPYAATRRAIVRAAAEIGKGMK